MTRRMVSHLRPPRAARRTFRTDRELRALQPGEGWYDAYDEVQRGVAVRVGPRGADGKFRKTFVMVARFDGKNPTRRRLGEYGAMTLEEARGLAGDWRKLVVKGIDPKIEEQRAKRERQTKNASTFEAVAERYVAHHLKDKRRGKDDAREIRKFLVTAWRGRPISELTPQDVKELIKPIGRRTPAQAHVVLNHIKRIFSWVLNDDLDYGVTQSPAALLKPAKLIGERKVRTRVLDDDELMAFWKATGKLGYPMGDLYRLIALTGVRISEASGAVWSEFNFEERLWRIPSERFKSEQEHVVPLSGPALSLLCKLPGWSGGGFLFSTTGGRRPIGGFSKPKARLDALMAEELGELRPFVIHDVRRTFRSRLSALKVDRTVAELCIGHARRGLERTYDQHQFIEEMREALERWADLLLEIVGEKSPKAHNIIMLPTRATS